MSIPDFLRPRLVGKRFEGHSIPLELLGDLAVLEAMVIEVAKWRYLQDNPNRKRSPRKFTEGISLTLTSVEQGSAVAVIAIAIDRSTTIVEWPSEKKKPTATGRFPSCINFRVTLSMAAM